MDETITFVGMDAHKNGVSAAIAEGGLRGVALIVAVTLIDAGQADPGGDGGDRPRDARLRLGHRPPGRAAPGRLSNRHRSHHHNTKGEPPAKFRAPALERRACPAGRITPSAH